MGGLMKNILAKVGFGEIFVVNHEKNIIFVKMRLSPQRLIFI